MAGYPPRRQPPPPPRHAAPTGNANQGDNAGPPRPHIRAHSTWVAEGERLTSDAPRNGERRPPRGHPSASARKGARLEAEAGSPRQHQPHPGQTGHRTPAGRPRRRAAGRGTAPDTRHPSQRWRATPPGRAPHHVHGTQPPQDMQAKGAVLGPHTRTPALTARGYWTPTARQEGGQSGEGERLTSDAPHKGGRHPPGGRPSATATAHNAGTQGRTLWGWCWVPTPAPTAPETHGSRNPGCPPRRTSSRGRNSA